MALEIVGGAVVGAAVTELLKAVTDAKDKATNFQQALTRLESTLRSVIPRVNEISLLNHKLKVSDEEMKELITILRNGQALVNKSSKISSVNLVKKGQYSKELLELDYSLLRYFQTILPLDHFRDTKEMLLMMRELYRGLVSTKDGSSEILSSQQPDEGKSSKSKVDEYSEIKLFCQEPDEGESSKPKVEEYSEIKSCQEPDEGESSKPKGDEYSEIQSCQDLEKKETVKLFGKVLLMMRVLHMGLVGAKDEEDSSKPKEDGSSQEPDEGESSKPKEDGSSQEPDKGESSKPKEDESSQEPNKGESSKPKVAEYSEIKSCQEPDEEESSKPKGDEYSEIQSCQDIEKKETVKLFGKVLLMMRGLHMGLVGAKDEEDSSKPKEDESSQEPDRRESSKPKEDGSSQEPDEGESSKPKEDESSQEPGEGESNKPKVDDYSEIKSCQEPDEGESSKPKGDEYSKIQSCQDLEKKETVKLFGKVLLMMRGLYMGLVGAKDEDSSKPKEEEPDERESSKPKEDESSQEPDEGESSKPKVDEYSEIQSCQDPEKKETKTLKFVGGAVLGAAVGELLKAVIDAKEKVTNFQPALKRLESTMRSIIPLAYEISRLNHELKVPDEEMKEVITILQNGKALVNKSSKISSINLVRRAQYSKELLGLDYSLLSYFQTILPLDHLRNEGNPIGATDEEDSSKLNEDESSQEPDEGESNKSKVEYSEIKSKVDEYFYIKSSQEPDEGESSKLKGDEYSEIQSCQDPENGSLFRWVLPHVLILFIFFFFLFVKY